MLSCLLEHFDVFFCPLPCIVGVSREWYYTALHLLPLSLFPPISGAAVTQRACHHLFVDPCTVCMVHYSVFAALVGATEVLKE